VPLITSFTPGTPRNNLSGWRGTRIMVGADPLQVTQLGRVYRTGNVQDHELRLVRASDKVVVASAIWTPAGGVNNQFKYAPLAAPVNLPPGTEYYLVSREVSGGDGLYSFDTTVVTSGAAAVMSAIYSTDGVNYVVPSNGPGPYSYVPVSLLYCRAAGCLETEWVTGYTAGTLRNNVSGWRGTRLMVGGAPVIVTQLGRIFLNGNVQNHEVRLVRASDKALIASVVWTPAGGVHGQIKHVALAAAVTLAANTEYYLVAQEFNGGDFLYSLNTVVATTAVAAIQSAIYSTDGVNYVVPSNGPGPYSYGPVGFEYCRPN